MHNRCLGFKGKKKQWTWNLYFLQGYSSIPSILIHRFWRRSMTCELRYWPRKLGYDFGNLLALWAAFQGKPPQFLSNHQSFRSSNRAFINRQTCWEISHVFTLTIWHFREYTVSLTWLILSEVLADNDGLPVRSRFCYCSHASEVRHPPSNQFLW